MIKNLLTVLLPNGFDLDLDVVNEGLASKEFHPCSAMQTVRSGWRARGDREFVKKIGDHLVMTYVTEKKTVPGPVLKAEIKEGVEEYERRMGEKPSRADMKAIKEEAIAHLLPRAFPKQTETLVWIDLGNKTLNFNTATTKRMEEVLVSLMQTVVGFPDTARINTVIAPTSAMSGWIVGDAPHGLTVDDKCELVSPVENKPTIRYVRHSLEGNEVKTYIAEGKIPVSLAMTHEDRLSFTLTEGLIIKGITPLDLIENELNEAEADAESAETLFDTEFLLVGDELGALMQSLIRNMGGVQAAA